MHAYDKIYLGKAQTVLGRMLDFAVHDLEYGAAEFFEMFLLSGVAERFERGEANLLVGKSGIELAYEVAERCGDRVERVKTGYTEGKSPEYWAGWALAYYQWETALKFCDIVRLVPLTNIILLYSPYHEMDIRQFVDKMNELCAGAAEETNLKRYRKRLGLSQSELAKLSEVPLRTIQQYEQRKKNINKAQAVSLVNMAKTLYCDVEDLLEPELKENMEALR